MLFVSKSAPNEYFVNGLYILHFHVHRRTGFYEDGKNL